MLTSFGEAVFNPSTLPRYFHTVLGALVSGSFLMAAISADLLLRGKAVEEARRSLAVSVLAGAAFSLLVAFPAGHEHAKQVAHTQPEKFAAIEGLYTGSDGNAPLVLFAVPSAAPPHLHATVEIPSLLSWMAFGDPNAPVRGLNDFPPDRVAKGAELWLSFVSFHNMVVLGGYFIGLTWLATFFLWRGTLHGQRWLLQAFKWSWPLPLAACSLGWMTAEVGRQPWIVYGLLRTQDAASKTVTAGEVLFSIVLFGAIYSLLGALWLYLLIQKVQHGPEEVA